MKSLTIFIVCACLAVVTLPAWGQAANAKTGAAINHGILGYLDPGTGAFKPMRVRTPHADAPTSPPPVTQGTFVIGLTINVISSFPSDETYTCGAESTVFDESGLDFEDDATVTATRSGNTVTCTVTIPYYWRLADPSMDTVTVGFDVVATGPASSNGQPTRETRQDLVVNYPIPANFRTTTFNQGGVL